MILRRTALAAVPMAAVALLLSGCTGDPGPEASTAPSGSSSTSPTSPVSEGSATPLPTAAAELPGDSTALARWADLSLPANSVGGGRAIARGTGQIGPAGQAVELPAEAAGLQIVVACQSIDGTPLRLSFGGSGEASEIPCTKPGGAPAPLTRLAARAGTVQVDASTDAVFVYEVRRAADT